VRQKHGKTLSSCGIPARLSTTEIVAVAQLAAATAADLLLPRMAADGEVEIKYAIYGLPVTRATMHFITNAKANRFWERKTNRRAVAARATNLSRRPKTTEPRNRRSRKQGFDILWLLNGCQHFAILGQRRGNENGDNFGAGDVRITMWDGGPSLRAPAPQLSQSPHFAV
jgi:hypothetical protein